MIGLIQSADRLMSKALGGRLAFLSLAALGICAVMLTAAWPSLVRGQTSDPPGKPTNLTGTVTHNSVILTWEAPTNSAVTGYQILRLNRAVHNLGDFQTHVDDTGNTEATYTDTHVAAEARYVYRVKAKNGNLLSGRSNYFNADLPAVTSDPPSRPTGLAAAVTISSVTLTWNDPSDDSVTGYQILRRDKATTPPGGSFDIISDDTGSAVTTYTDSTVAAGGRYAYRVRARNSAGLSPKSQFVNASVPTSSTEVTVGFGQPNYEVVEGESVSVGITLDVDPERTVVIPIPATNQGNTSGNDYSGVPTSVTFKSGETEKSIGVSAEEDADYDDEDIRLGFGPLPDGVSTGSPAHATVSITDDDSPVDLVGNMGRDFSHRVETYSGSKWAIRFTTGSADHNWILTSVRLQIASWAGGVTPTVALHSAGTGYEPGEFIAEMTNPRKGNGRRTFGSPADTLLEPETTYTIVLSSDGKDADSAVDYRSTKRDADDSGGADGWSLADDSLHFSSGSWSANTTAIKVAVVGAPLEEATQQKDRRGTVTLFPKRPKVGMVISATLTDADGLEGGTSGAAASLKAVYWIWARSADRSVWIDIEPYGHGDSYTATTSDEGQWLRAKAVYTDGHGSGKSAKASTTAVASAREAAPELTITELVTDLSYPWDIAFTPDGTMLFTQRGGVLSARLTDGTIQQVTADFSDLNAQGYTGLQALAVDPDFSTNRRFYTLQSHDGPEVQVIAWTIDADYTTATRVVDPLLSGMPVGPGPWHTGGRLLFDSQGYLWVATGDGYSGTAAQDLSSLGGKVLRVDPQTGAGAPGNPFSSSPRVYAYGHRNLQGMSLRPGTNQIWLVQHGPDHDDEINLLVAGGNYGWDPVPDEGSSESYDETTTPMTDLVKFPAAQVAKWSSGYPTLAASGADFLQGSQWGTWEGRLAVATLKTKSLRLFEFTDQGDLVSQIVVPEFDGTYGRLRTPVLGPDRALYITTSNGNSSDKILRIAVNRAATGLPTVRGMAQVGETQTADTSGIGDADGLSSVTYKYQWVRSDGTTDTDISGATESTYSLVLADEGKTVKVMVSFTDDWGNAEELTSSATESVAARPNSVTTGAPTISGTAQVGETLTADTSGIGDADGLSHVSHSYQWTRGDGTTHTDISGATESTYSLVLADEGKTVKVRVSFTDDVGYAEELTSAATASVAALPNSAATGAPTISGTVQVGETLTADMAGIGDTNGLSNVRFSYRWVRSDGTTDADIKGATGSTYTLVKADQSKTIKVRVSFTDDIGYAEALTSTATDSIEATSGESPVWGATMTAAPLYVDHGYSDFDGFRYGSLTTTSFAIGDVMYTVRVIEASGWLYIGFDKEIPVAFTLDVDGTRLESSDASLTSYSYSKNYEWQGSDIDWSEGDRVEFKLYESN